VDNKVLTIKFKSNVTDKEIASFETTHRLKMLRRAATGFIDYEIAPVQDIVVLHDELKGVEVIEAIQLNYLGNWYFQPNDPLVSLQWYLDKIQAFAAWDNSRGSQEIVVAVLDTGIDWSHPDFAGAIYSNSAEIPGNGLDDDDNGFVDDIHGWNFENNNSNINDLSGTQSFHGHGTRVSGIIGAQLNNSIGIAGIGGGIRIMPVKVGSEGPLSSIVDDAILYAAQNGAKIINMSFGWQSVVEDNPANAAIDAAITMAKEQYGCLLIAASGHSSSSNVHYPARHDLVLSVGGSTKDDLRPTQSDYGNKLKIAAPYEQIISTNVGGGYSQLFSYQAQGTSLSCAIVSGVAALILSKYPCLTPDQVTACLLQTADKVGGYDYNRNGRAGHSWEMGYGRVNAEAAIKYVENGLFANSSDYSTVTYFTNATISGISQPSGHIVINPGVTLTITGELRMMTNATIVVKRGARLIVDGGKITRRLCFSRWAGIFVEGNSSVLQPVNPASSLSPNGPGVVWLKNNALIEYAHNAITTTRRHEAWNAAYWGGLVVAENATFYNNRRSVEFMKYDHSNNSRFVNCNFIDETGEAFAGVTIWDTDNILFDGCKFSTRNSGVLAWDAGAIVRNGCQFFNMRVGVESYATSPVSSGSFLRVGDSDGLQNVFVNNIAHIESYSSVRPKGIEIVNNRLLSGGLPPIGVFIDGSSRYTIVGNSLEDVDIGIQLINTYGHDNHVECNDFSLGTFGVVIAGDNSGLNVRENNFSTSFGDIILWDEGNASTGIFPFQGTIGDPAHNCFSSDFEHIWTVGPTIPFVYYVPIGQENTCKMPSQQSILGTNNYQVEFIDVLIPHDCPIIPLAPPPHEGPYTYSHYLSAKNGLAYLEGIIGAGSSNLQTRAAWAEQYRLKHKIIDWFLSDAIASGQLGNALQVLNSENTREAQRLIYGLYVQQKQYAAAVVALNAIPQSDKYDEEFYAVQQINLARLQHEGEFTLSALQRETLKNIAYSKSPERGHARGLLSLLEGYYFEPDTFAIPAYPAAMIAMPNTAPARDLPDAPLLFPNPAQDRLSVQIPSTWKGSGRIIVTDMPGRTIMERPWGEGQNVELDVHALRSGIYLLVCEQNGQALFHGKIVKQ